MTPDRPTATPDDVVGALRGRLVVSCQAREGEPLHGPAHMTAMALSALDGGAAGLRLEGPADVAAVRAVTGVPIIGLWKAGAAPVYITPTMDAVHAVADAGADIVAVDGTGRPRPDGSTFADVVRAVHGVPGRLVMADVATLAQGRAAEAAGADLVGSTLSGYTGPGRPPAGPDLTLVGELAAALSVPVVAEGRIATAEQAAEALLRGATTVVVGGAITRPASITARFAAALDSARTALVAQEGAR
ncbi:N-acetylmannosamine-6-phosphate 2-epimerase [Isoptericola sp. S6320L]|uniref:N-acetylmannosamine-6-phosphate 2-epimerase n=1 Tax=Isoptericola sp. S6320L TaxID=2926411 RepID=UPI001FF57064|nr:N-acetylmannosamine-6-phosphate 2-epimerase [Isoptericola sp. S6320L]MCK0115952.1 N-acetylmannosamine-6-phosphate 2-epimerase [Isoptericola sp. S6320L]